MNYLYLYMTLMDHSERFTLYAPYCGYTYICL